MMAGQGVWSTPAGRRVLLYTDLLACFTSLSAFVAATHRLSAQLHPDQQQPQSQQLQQPHQQQPHAQASGSSPRLLPQAPVQILLICTFLGPVLLQLFLMFRKPHLYHRHRTALCAVNRLLRLAGVFANTCTAAGRLPILRSLAARLHAERGHPDKAVGVVTLQPIQFFGQAALFVLPLRHVTLMQLFTTAATMWGWARFTPCLLSHPSLSPQDTAAVQAAAQRACTRLQAGADSLQVVMSAVLPEGVLAPYRPACAAVTALQTLQCFGILTVLFVLPVGAVFLAESWLRVQQQAAAQQAASALQQQQPGAAASHAGSSSSGSSSSSGAGRLPGTAGSVLSSLALVNSGCFGLPLTGLHLCLLAPVVPLLTWALSELLPQVFDEPECPFHSAAAAAAAVGSTAHGGLHS